MATPVPRMTEMAITETVRRTVFQTAILVLSSVISPT